MMETHKVRLSVDFLRWQHGSTAQPCLNFMDPQCPHPQCGLNFSTASTEKKSLLVIHQARSATPILLSCAKQTSGLCPTWGRISAEVRLLNAIPPTLNPSFI